MFLSKKDTPKEYYGMFYAGVLNLVVSLYNLFLYYAGGSGLSMFSCVMSLTVSIVIFTYIKRQAQKELWEKLQRPEQNSRSGTFEEWTS